jgi:hypothetical protein
MNWLQSSCKKSVESFRKLDRFVMKADISESYQSVSGACMTILFWAGIVSYGLYDLITMSVTPYLWTQITYNQELVAYGQLWGFPFENE